MGEVKKAVINRNFWIGAVALTIAFFVSGQPYMETILRTGCSVEGIGWIEVFQYCTENEKGQLFVPLCAPFAAGIFAEAELKSRYALFVCSRIGRKNYYVKKIAEAALPGGMMVCASQLFLLGVSYARFHEITSYAGTADRRVIFLFLMAGLFRGFLNGAFWALLGSFFAVITKSVYMAYSVPFVLYYVLTVFQQRYYQGLYFLSPRHWAVPDHYSNGFCMLMLTVLLTFVGIGFFMAVRRRLGYE